jgi:hypothetical protein
MSEDVLEMFLMALPEIFRGGGEEREGVLKI